MHGTTVGSVTAYCSTSLCRSLLRSYREQQELRPRTNIHDKGSTLVVNRKVSTLTNRWVGSHFSTRRLVATHQSAQLRWWLQAWQFTDALAHFFPPEGADTEVLRLFQAAQHSYAYTVNGARETSRLDRWYISAPTTAWIQEVKAVDLGGGSDHAAVMLDLADPARRVPVRTRRRCYPPKAAAAEGVSACITRALEVLQADFDDFKREGAHPESYLLRWETFKAELVREIGCTAKEALALVNRSFKFKIARLRRRIREPGRETPEIVRNENELEVAVARWRGLKQRQRLSGAFDDHTTAAVKLYARTALPRAAQLVTAIASTPGAPTRGLHDLANRIRDGWARTFTQQERRPRAEPYVEFDAPPLQAHEKTTLGAQFTRQEVAASIKRCKRTKSGGPDQLPNAFYRDHAEALAPILLRLANVCYEHGVSPPSFQTATIICLPKTGRTEDPLGYKPISLLNTDYKIYMRLLTTRLKPLLPRMITARQGGFVPGKTIHEVIDIFNGAQRQATLLDTDTVAVLLDIRKA